MTGHVRVEAEGDTGAVSRPRRAPVAEHGRLLATSPAAALALQRSAGNAAVGALLRPVVQTYVDTTGGGRLSDNGNIFRKNDHELYATESLVDSANAVLRRTDASHIGLGITARANFTNGRTYATVAPYYHHHPADSRNGALATANTPGNLLSLWADCGRASRVVMGARSTPPRATWVGGRTAASYEPKDYSDEIYPRLMRAFLRSSWSRPYLVAGVHYTGSPGNIRYPSSPDDARAQYAALTPAVQRHLDRWAHINSGANPEVGGAYTMNTEYAMPGSAEVPGHARWNFHWAGVVLKDGADNVTLENYAVGNPNAVNRDWNFEMYGTVKQGQSFHEQHLASGTHGTRATSFEVERT